MPEAVVAVIVGVAALLYARIVLGRLGIGKSKGPDCGCGSGSKCKTKEAK